MKNRNRGNYEFANINLLGKCNADCFFCLGKDIEDLLKNQNQLNIHYLRWNNFIEFLDKCRLEGIEKLYLTGQTADGLQYKYLDDLVEYLIIQGFKVGLRTNGYLALQKIKSIKKFNDEIGYSIHSLNTNTNKIIMGRSDIPKWEEIIPQSGHNVRVSIVLNKYNCNEFFEILSFISVYDNVKYIQVRKVSSDTRQEELAMDMLMFETFYEHFNRAYKKESDFYLSQQFEIYGKKIFFWRTTATSINSMNYFTDGTISDNYFVVEGYLNNYKNITMDTK